MAYHKKHKQRNEPMRTWIKYTARETACGQVGFGFVSDWLSTWRKCFKPITMSNEAKPKQFRITFDTHLKTVLTRICFSIHPQNGHLQSVSEVIGTPSPFLTCSIGRERREKTRHPSLPIPNAWNRLPPFRCRILDRAISAHSLFRVFQVLKHH